jgi:hypothetical protein
MHINGIPPCLLESASADPPHDGRESHATFPSSSCRAKSVLADSIQDELLQKPGSVFTEPFGNCVELLNRFRIQRDGKFRSMSYLHGYLLLNLVGLTSAQ